MSGNLITKYRPQSFQEVIGQAAVVRSLQQLCKKKDAHAFLFSGPHGTGKTTLARLVAQAYECNSVLELDAATFTGIESMRNVQELLRYRPFGANGNRAIILDEAHGLSKQAFDSLLKTLEEPPAHVVWCFCTTNPTKLPKTLTSRCAKFQLKLVEDKQLWELYDFVVEQENLYIPDDVADLLIREAKGSPRELLSNIVVARTARDKKEAAELLKTAIETNATLDLCRFVANGNGSWQTCMGFVRHLEDENAESIRILVVNYLAKCLKEAKSDDAAVRFLQKIEAFAEPYQGSDGQAPLVLSLGRALFAE